MKKVKGGHTTTAGTTYVCFDHNIGVGFNVCSQTAPVLTDCDELSICIPKHACDPAVPYYNYTCG